MNYRLGILVLGVSAAINATAKPASMPEVAPIMPPASNQPTLQEPEQLQHELQRGGMLEGASPAWVDRFGTDGEDWVNSVIELRNGDVLAAGFVDRGQNRPPPGSDLIVRRYRTNGHLRWSQRYGGAALDAGWAAVEMTDGRIAIAGPSASHSAGETDAWLLILDRHGRLLNEHRYGGPKEDFVTGLTTAPDGGLVLTGWTQSIGAGGRDVLLIRTDKDGRELWRRAYGGPDIDRGFYVKATRGGYVVAGVTGTADNFDFLLMKIDDKGDVVWRRAIGGPGNDPTHGLNILPDGRIRLIGYTRSWGARDYDLAALTFTSDGRLLRLALLGGPADDRAQLGAVTADGSSWIIGYTKSRSRGAWDILLARVRPDGFFENWMGAIGTTADDNGSTIALARNGDLLLGGYANRGTAASAPDAFVMRVRPRTVTRYTDDLRAWTVDSSLLGK